MGFWFRDLEVELLGLLGPADGGDGGQPNAAILKLGGCLCVPRLT